MFNMSGQPSMSVPLAWSKSGLPLGMMFTGRFGDEATLFRLAGQLEQERPWRERIPPVQGADESQSERPVRRP
jgi:amidase/6-aminohexanoate-cyclic-dimer hydrolase